MEYARIGNSGLRTSRIILGTLSYGDPKWAVWVKNEEESLPLLKAAWDAGINTWDTADIYSNGASERMIAKAIEKYNIPRKNLVILSKCYFGVPESPDHKVMDKKEGKEWVNNKGLSRKHILEAVDASVKRLGTYIDVLQIHRLDREVPKEEIMKALHDVVESGKVRYIGASSMFTWEFQMLQNIAEKNRWTKFISMQNYYNLLYREEEREMIPYCEATGVGIIPWSPLARGVLARAWNDCETLRSSTDEFLKRSWDKDSEVDKMVVARVGEIAKKHGVNMAVVATAWVLSKGAHPILGLGSVDRIEDAVKALSFKLTEEEAKYLEELYQPKATRGILV